MRTFSFLLLFLSSTTIFAQTFSNASYLIKDKLENYIGNPEYRVLACKDGSWKNYTYVVAKNLNDFGGPIGLFDYREVNLLQDFVRGFSHSDELPFPINLGWQGFQSYQTSPETGIHGWDWYYIKWSADSHPELRPDFEIRLYVQRTFPLLYPEYDYLFSTIKCEIQE